MVRIGIIGCGYISRFHCEGYQLAGGKIVHVCDVNEETAKKAGSLYGAKASTDYRAVLDDPNVDLVNVLTYTSSHKEIILAAIAAGKGVVCEKTLSENPADSAEIALAVKKAGVFFATAYMKRFFPAAQQVKKMLPEMGQIISIYARSWQPAADYWGTPPETHQTDGPSAVRRQYGGGVLVCGGSHILDLLHWFAGKPTSVCGQMYTVPGCDFDVQANAMLWLEEGGLAHFEACWHPLFYVGYERNGWDERFEINTSKGRLDLYTVTWNMPEHNGALLVHNDAATGRTTEYRYQALNPFHIEMAEVIRRFEAGEKGFPSAHDGYVVDELIAHIAASAQQKSVLPVTWRKI